MAKDNKNKTAYELMGEQIKEANNNPTIKAMQKMEADRIALINKSIAQWHKPSALKIIKEFEETLKSVSSTQAFPTIQDYESYAKPLIGALELSHFEEAKKALEGNLPHFKQSYLQAQSAIEQLQKTLSSTSVQSVLSELDGLNSYKETIKRATDAIANNQNIIDATQSLSNVRQSLVEDSFKHNIEDNILENSKIKLIDIKPINVGKNPFSEQNKQILEQNNELIKLGKLQNKSLADISEYTQEQNKDIKKQNKDIKKQIKQKDREIRDNRKVSTWTIRIAIASILISIVASYMSYDATYTVYEKEKIENNQDNKLLINAVNNKSEQNNQLLLLLKEMKTQNKLLKQQNSYLKTLTQKNTVEIKNKVDK